MNIALIGILVIVGIFVLIKIKRLVDAKQHLAFTLLLILVILFVFSAVYVWMKTGINLKTYDGFISLGKTYFSWIGSAFSNLGKITGYAINQPWALNSSASS
ncbi:MAG: hypothetical protein QXD13_01195 [Candidatus Pacearchaeota archaeon]